MPIEYPLQNNNQHENKLNNDQKYNQELLRTSIEQGKTLGIRVGMFQGDALISVWAHYQVFTNFCRDNNIPLERIRLDILPPGGFSEGEGEQPLNVSHVEALYGSNHPVFKEDPMYERVYKEIAQPYGIPVQRADFQQAPQPIRVSTGPLHNFDRNLVIAEGEAQRQYFKDQNKTPIAIIQSGGSQAKRFTDAQIRDMVEIVKRIRPDTFISVITDKVYFQGKDAKEFGANFPTDNADFMMGLSDLTTERYGSADAVVSGNINSMGARAYASLIVASDSFGAWFTGGCKAMNPAKNGILQSSDMICLYAIADPDFWRIPNISIVSSSILDIAKQKNRIDPTNRIIDPKVYFTLQMTQDLNVRKYIHRPLNIPIRDSDIEKLLEKTMEVLETNYPA